MTRRTAPLRCSRLVAFGGDCVAKLIFGFRANFSKGAGAFARKLCRGSHEQSNFQPAAFVSSYKSSCRRKSILTGKLQNFSAPSFLSFATQSGGGSGHRTTIANRSLLTHRVTSPPSITALRKAHSITSSAVASSAGGTSRPSVLAVLRLMTNSYFVGSCTGRSAGISPFRMRST
jgi:hypothetical protein